MNESLGGIEPLGEGESFILPRVDKAGDRLLKEDVENIQSVGRSPIRIILSPTRSGSTALLRCFENNSFVDQVYHQPIKSGYRQDGEFDYSFFELDSTQEERILVAKETVGGFKQPETEFSPLPNSGEHEQIGPWIASPSEIEKFEPLILIRDPIQTWGSIERLNIYSQGISRYHSPFEYFVPSYRNIAEFIFAAKERNLPVHCVTQEILAENPNATLQKVCDKWNIPWADSMVNWNQPYGIKTWFSKEALNRMENDPRFKRSKESLQASTKYNYRPSEIDFIEDKHANIIERELYPLYERATIYADEDFRK